MNELQSLPAMDIPLFESGKIFFCRNHQEWIDAHESLGASAQMLDRKGGANTFKSTNGTLDVHLLGVFDRSVATLSHEAAHLVFDICGVVGVEVEKGQANETFCYLLDKVVEFGNQNMAAE